MDLVDELAARREDIAGPYLRSVTALVTDERRIAELTQATDSAFDQLIAALRDDAVGRQSWLDFSRPLVRRAMLAGVTPVSLQSTGRALLRAVLHVLTEMAGDDPAGQAAVLEFMTPLLNVVDVALDAADEAMREAQDARAASSQAADSELLALLLSGRRPESATARAAAERCGLSDDSPFVLVVARAALSEGNHVVMPFAASGLARAMHSGHPPLVALHEGGVVLVRVVADGEEHALDSALQAALERLSAEDIALRVGGSACHTGMAAIPAAYAEAQEALGQLATGECARVYWALDISDYALQSAHHDTAWRLLPAAVRTFVSDDLERSGALVDTVEAYLAARLQVSAAAEQLFIHRGTTQYRLRQVTALTGCDLRDFHDLRTLDIAIRLARQRRRSDPPR